MLNRRLRHVIYNGGGSFPHRTTCPVKDKDCIKPVVKSDISLEFAIPQNPILPETQFKISTHISDDEIEDEEYIYSVKPAESQTQHVLHVKLPLCQVYVNNKPVDVLIDSGASVNIIDSLTFGNIF